MILIKIGIMLKNYLVIFIIDLMDFILY